MGDHMQLCQTNMKTSRQNLPSRLATNRVMFENQKHISEPVSNPPCEIFQDNESHGILFNMPGIPESNIKVRLDKAKRRLTVFAEKIEPNFADQFLWVFSLPKTADLRSFETFYKNDVVQFRFLKRPSILAAAV